MSKKSCLLSMGGGGEGGEDQANSADFKELLARVEQTASSLSLLSLPHSRYNPGGGRLE